MADLDRLTSILNQLTGKTAEEAPRPGGQADEKSNHPTTDKSDDGLVVNPTGELAKQDSRMLADQGQANIADKSDASSAESQESVEVEAGLKRTGVGNDPATEGNLAATLEEPGVGTSHPARFADGEKYANILELPLDQQLAQLTKMANEVVAELLVSNADATTKTAASASAPAESDAVQNVDGASAVDADLVKHAQAGYTAAKVAQDRAAMVLRSVCADARLDAWLAADFFSKVAQEAAREDDAGTPAPAGDTKADESAPPPGAAGGSHEPAAPGTSDLMSAAEKAPGAPHVSPDAAVAELAAVLDEMGITPEDLEALIAGSMGGGADAGMGGGAPGGTPPAGGMGGGAPGEMPPAGGMGGEPKLAGVRLTGERAAQAAMVASRVRAFKRAQHDGRQPKRQSDPKLRVLAKQALLEIMGR